MKLKSKKGIILLTLFSILVLLGICKWALNSYINSKIRNTLKEIPNTEYSLTFEKFEADFFYTQIHLANLEINTATSSKASTRPKIQGTIQNVSITGISALEIVRGKKIDVNQVRITHPKVTVINTSNSSNKNQKESSQPKPELRIDNLKIEKGSLLFVKDMDSIQKDTLEIASFTIQVKNLKIPQGKTNQAPKYSYDDLELNLEHITNNISKFYRLSMDQIQYTDKQLTVDNLNLVPKYSRQKHVSLLAHTDDIFTIASKKITLDQFNFGLDSVSKFYLTSDALRIENLNALIYRDKTPTPSMAFKPLFSKKLRDLDFNVRIDSTAIYDSQLTYQEADANSIAPGTLTFTKFNATITNLTSANGQNKVEDTKIKVNSLFMNDAPLYVDWKFNVLNPLDEFTISGTIKNFDAKAMNGFLKPYVKASTTGQLKRVSFNFYGNNQEAKGAFAMNHKNLEVTLYSADGKQKRAFISKIGNWFIKKDSDGKFNQVEIKKVERTKEKSFFNYLWLCILQGLKQTVL